MTATKLNLADWHDAARAQLSEAAYAYYASGANDEITLRENRLAFDTIALRYRVLRDVAVRDISTNILGARVSMPVVVAPTAFHQLADPDGEVATARAAEAAQTILTLSSLSNRAVETVVASTAAPVWFQLYVYRDRTITEAMLDRVEAAGCQAIVFTVDAPLLGRRERDLRQAFSWPTEFQVENLLPLDHPEAATAGTGADLATYFSTLLDPAIRWRDLEWLCARSSIPVLVKGIVHPDDARLAIEHGAQGVVVSNHGGRQLDTAVATIRALPDVAHVLARLDTSSGAPPTLLLDGGVRRGTDVVKALAYGADGVMIGRPVLWGLAAEGEAGARAVLELMRNEVDLALGLCGCRSVAEVSDDLLVPPPR